MTILDANSPSPLEAKVDAKLDAKETGDSKEAVLDAAQRLIFQYGYTGFSMRDLAQQSGLAKATLYHHFHDKREIFLQVLDRDLRAVRDRIAVAAATPGDLPSRLHAIVDAFFELTTERGMLLFTTLRQAAGMEQEFCMLMRSYRDELQRPVVEMLREQQLAGTIRAIDPDLAASSFFWRSSSDDNSPSASGRS